MNAAAQDAAGPINRSQVPSRKVRDPVLSILVLAPGHPLSPVPMKAMPAPAFSVSALYRAATDFLCLYVLTSPLVQDFARPT